MKITIGKGIKETGRWSMSFPREAELAEDMRTMTFQQIGEQLAKQFGVKDGEVNLIEIVFTMKTSRE